MNRARVESLQGPQPVLGGAVLGFVIGGAHGLYRATQVDTNAPMVEGARGWFIGMAVMIGLISLCGRISDAPIGTPPIGHFLAWSKTLQRMLIAIPLSISAFVIYLHSPGFHDHMHSFGMIGLACILGSILVAVVVSNVIAGVYGLAPRTAEQRSNWSTKRSEFFARFKTAAATAAGDGRSELDAFCEQAIARQAAAREAAYERYLEALAEESRVEEAGMNPISSSCDPGEGSKAPPSYLDAEGHLLTPRELLDGDELPPLH